MRMREIAQTPVRYGYRMIRVLSNREGWKVGKDLVYRLLHGRRIRPAEAASRAATCSDTSTGALSTDRSQSGVGHGFRFRPTQRWATLPCAGAVPPVRCAARLFCNGYQGFVARFRRPVLELTPDVVSSINEHGGTILGSSRGEQDPAAAVVDCLERMGINPLFVIGGDGTIRGAMGIVREISERGTRLPWLAFRTQSITTLCSSTTASGFRPFSEATKSIRAAHAESIGVPNGVGLVKLMGRHSGSSPAT